MHSKAKFFEVEKMQLIEWLEQAHLKLDQKNLQLRTARQRLNAARSKLSKLKETVVYQRNRIIELTPPNRRD